MGFKLALYEKVINDFNSINLLYFIIPFLVGIVIYLMKERRKESGFRKDFKSL
jgi:uncharacterized membrane protein YbhN (UPF0104 family)